MVLSCSFWTANYHDCATRFKIVGLSTNEPVKKIEYKPINAARDLFVKIDFNCMARLSTTTDCGEFACIFSMGYKSCLYLSDHLCTMMKWHFIFKNPLLQCALHTFEFFYKIQSKVYFVMSYLYGSQTKLKYQKSLSMYAPKYIRFPCFLLGQNAVLR